MRISLQTLRVLKVLVEQPSQQHYGLEILERTGLSAGSLYPILGRLEAAGWLTGEWETIDPAVEGRPRRRYYRLTSTGLRCAQQAVREATEAIVPDQTVNERKQLYRPQRRLATGLASLTPTEKTIAALIGEGLTNREIAERLYISIGTVETHLVHIFTKLGITSRSELAHQLHNL
jgi:PadR family transcriptional regulator, regulatory protein PadR